MTNSENNQCVYGQWLDLLSPLFYRQYQKYLAPDSGISGAEIHRESTTLGFEGGLTSVKAHRKQECLCFKEDAPNYDSENPYADATIEASADEINVHNVVIANPLAPGETGIFDKVFEIAGLNKEDYRLVDDSVVFKTWNTSARPRGDAPRDIIVLYSYGAKFVRVTELQRRTEELVTELAENAAKRRQGLRRTPGTGLGTPMSFTFLASDWQLGKPEIREQDLAHGLTGVEQTTWRIERALSEAVDRVKKLRSIGYNIESTSIGFMGDPTENVSDSYTNQQYTVELNLIDQIERSLDLMELVTGELLEISDEPGNIFAVLCNHGQMTRKNTKTNVTDDADNVQNLLMRILKERIIGPAFPGTHWYLPGDQMITTLDIAGVPVAAAHGHKIPSGINGEAKWLAAQTANLTAKRNHTPRLWLTAHRHSHDSKDYGPYHRLQAATADGGSKHFEDGTGVYSTPGTSIALIGNHDERGYSHFDLI